jgi:hypothetical protein
MRRSAAYGSRCRTRGATWRETRVGTHSSLRSGQSTAVGSAPSSLQLPASLHECDRRAVRPNAAPPRTAPGRGPAPAWARPSAHSSPLPAPAPPRAQDSGQRCGRTGAPRACTCRATPGALSPSWSRWTCRAPCGRARRGSNSLFWAGPRP